MGEHGLFAAMPVSGEVNIARTDAGDYWSRIKLENDSEEPALISTTMPVLSPSTCIFTDTWTFEMKEILPYVSQNN